MPDFIEITQKRAVAVLADLQDFAQAADRLGLTVFELRREVATLEQQLCLRIFDEGCDKPTLTAEGRRLLCHFREALRRHNLSQETRQ